MPRAEHYFKIRKDLPINEKFLKLLEEHFDGNLSKCAKAIEVSVMTISNVLHKKSSLEPATKIKIARFFGKDTIEIF